MKTIVASLVGSLLAVVLVISIGLFRHRESPHERDLRDCRERYGATSPYAPSDYAAFRASLVAACMRGRGY